MYVCKDKKKSRKSSKKESSSDSEGDVAPARQKTDPKQDKDPSEMTEAEKRIYNILRMYCVMIYFLPGYGRLKPIFCRIFGSDCRHGQQSPKFSGIFALDCPDG